MDMPLDHRLFDPPPKQHAQSAATRSAHQQQQRHYPLKLSNSQQHHHNSSSVSNTNLSGLSFAKGHQNEPSEMCATRITQSGSYVEILKNTAYQNLHSDAQAQKSAGIGGGLKKSAVNGHVSSSSCQNKSYGDFLTITPRRKGKLLSTSAAIGNDRYQHSIEPLHLLGVRNDHSGTIKSTKLYEYRTLETLSNADTLLLGATIYPKLNKSYCAGISNLSSSGNNFDCGSNNSNKSSNFGEFQQILTEKNLSPPSAFSDGAEKTSLS